MTLKKNVVKIIALFGACAMLAGCGMQNGQSDWTNDSTLPNEPTNVKTELQGLKAEISSKREAWTAEYVATSQDFRTYDLVGLQLNVDGGSIAQRDETMYVEKTWLSEMIPTFQVEDKGEEGEVTISAPTYYYDDNGLLCIQTELVFSENEDCRIIKSYYYLNGNKYDEENIIPGRLLREKQQAFLPMQVVMQSFGFFYEEDSAGGLVRIKGGHLSCEDAVNTVYEPIAIKTVGGKAWNTGGKLVPAEQVTDESQKTRYTATPMDAAIPVRGNERLKVKLFSGWYPQVATFLFMDDARNIIGVFYTEHSENFDEIILVPKGATKMLMSLYSFQEYSLAREVAYQGVDLSTITTEEYHENMTRILSENKEKTLGNNPVIYKYDKGYISFVVDDMRPDLDQVVNIFEEYDIPVCIAAPGGFMNCGSLGKESMYEVCARAVKNGGEVLAHNVEVITEEKIDDIDAMFNFFYDRKYEIKRYGFDVNGIILSGGEGQIAGDSRTDLFVRNTYLYSDLYGEERLGEPYAHSRVWLGSIIGDPRSSIKNVMKEKKWEVYYFHDMREISEEQLRNILDVVKNLQREGLEVVNYSQIYTMMHE